MNGKLRIVPFRNCNYRAISKCKNNLFALIIDFREQGISIFSVVAGCLSEFGPAGLVIVGDPPVAILDFQLRSNSVITVLSGFTIDSGFSVFAVLTGFAVYAIPAVRTLGLDLVAGGVGQPCPVECPVIDAVIWSDADYRCGSVLAVFSVLTVLAVGPVVNRNGGCLFECNGVTDCLSPAGDRCDSRNVVAVLKSGYKSLQG